MTTSNQVYKIAKAHLGHKGSHARSFCGMSSGPYCCAFVTMCMHEAGGKKLFYGGKKCTYCPNAIKWAKANLAEVPPYLAMKMDLIFFDWQPNGSPDHIGFVLDKINTKQVKTLEGNTSGGIVAVKTRGGYIQGIFRPHYTPEQMPTKAKLVVDGDFGYKSIYMLQVALGLKPDAILGKQTVKELQRKVGASPDGSWGPKTSRCIQSRLLGFSGKSVDGDFGPKSVRAFQEWINAKCFPVAKKPPTTTAKKPTVVTTPQPSVVALKAVAWAKKIAKSGKYTYKKWNNKKANTKKCPICHPGSGNGWNCIGFCTAAYHHGGGLQKIECSCKGLGTDSFFTKVTLASWTKRNGKGWQMITNGGGKGGADIPASKLIAGDLLICYDKNGKFHHIVLYTGNSKYIDCTNTSKNHIAERPYSRITNKYHVTRAFRYVGN